MVDDARYRTKVWLTTYLNNAALTDDNDINEAKYLICYDYKPNDYPVHLIFRTPKDYDLLFRIGEPISAALYQADKSIYGYEETTPIIISAIDKHGITAEKLKWKAELELRRICETYPFGSLRLMSSRKDISETCSTTRIFSTEFTVTYRRDKTT